MIRYIGKRLLLGIFVLFGVSIMIFILSRVVPGDPGRLALGPRATQEAVDEMNRQLYMDKPLPLQYIYWMRDIFMGDLGISIVTRRSVSEDVSQFLPATLELVLFSGIFMVSAAPCCSVRWQRALKIPLLMDLSAFYPIRELRSPHLSFPSCFCFCSGIFGRSSRF